MQDRSKFRIAVFERYNTEEWEFINFIENSDKVGVSTSGNVIQANVQGLIIHLPREKTSENVYRTMEAVQCTGLKDKNGKLIYEGDIVKINTHYNHLVCDDYEYDCESEKGYSLFKIIYDDDMARFGAERIKCVKWETHHYSLDYVPHNHKVIGNIYETPELLED